MQGNPYWPLNGPSFFSVLRFFGSVLPRCPKSGVGFGSNFAARMASRRRNRHSCHDFLLDGCFHCRSLQNLAQLKESSI